MVLLKREIILEYIPEPVVVAEVIEDIPSTSPVDEVVSSDGLPSIHGIQNLFGKPNQFYIPPNGIPIQQHLSLINRYNRRLSFEYNDGALRNVITILAAPARNIAITGTFKYGIRNRIERLIQVCGYNIHYSVAWNTDLLITASNFQTVKLSNAANLYPNVLTIPELAFYQYILREKEQTLRAEGLYNGVLSVAHYSNVKTYADMIIVLRTFLRENGTR